MGRSLDSMFSDTQTLNHIEMMDRIDYDDSYCEQIVDKFLARCKKGQFKDEIEKRIYESLIP
jgi:hypothetical protein